MFNYARLKLTLWYLLIITVISLTFSAVIYRMLSAEVVRFERTQRAKYELHFTNEGRLYPFPIIPVPIINQELIEETKKRIFLDLLTLNVAIIILSGGLGYILAGRTLRPIKVMIDEQNRFITDASHELRTPLTALKSSFEVYLRGKAKTMEEANKLISESISDVDSLQYLSESLLELTQYQKPDLHIVFEKLDLPILVKEAVRKVEPLALKKNVSFKTEVDDIQLTGDRYSLVHLLLILLDNAVKYSPVESQVRLVARKDAKNLRIEIIDQGIGIGKKDQAHVFERFYRSDLARSKSGSDGYGLGLSIAQKIVDLHKGTIGVKSQRGKGTTFMVRLPL